MLCSMKWSSATLLLPSATLMNATALHPAYSSHALRDSRQLQARTAGNTATTRMQMPKCTVLPCQSTCSLPGNDTPEHASCWLLLLLLPAAQRLAT